MSAGVASEGSGVPRLLRSAFYGALLGAAFGALEMALRLAATKKPLTEREARHRAAEILQNSAPRADPVKSSEYFAAGYARYREELPRLELPNFHYLDLSTVFDDMEPGVDVFVDSYHFGDRGNRLIADRLYQELLPLLEQP